MLQNASTYQNESQSQACTRKKRRVTHAAACSIADSIDTQLLNRDRPDRNPAYSTTSRASIRVRPVISWISFTRYSSEPTNASSGTQARTLGSLDQNSITVVIKCAVSDKNRVGTITGVTAML